jgi:hypothetical protein
LILGTLLNEEDFVEDHNYHEDDLIGGSVHSSDQEDSGLILSPRAMLKNMRDEAHKKITIEIQQKKMN